MPPADIYQLPFITRRMLAFQEAAKIQLTITTRAVTASELVIVGATREGIFKFLHTTVNSATAQIEVFNLADLPIWLSVLDRDGDIPKGDVYCHIDLTINNDKILALTAGYLYQSHSLSWPATNIQESDPTDFSMSIVVGADPAAGSNLNVTMPTGTIGKIKSIYFTLVTDATVANRRVHLQVEIAGDTTYHFISSVDQAASQSRKYWLQPLPSAGTYSDDNDIIIPIANDIIWPGGDVLYTEVFNLQAGDNLTAAGVLVERSLTIYPL